MKTAGLRGCAGQARRQPSASPAGKPASAGGVRWAALLTMALALGVSSSVCAEMKFRYECRITARSQMPRSGDRSRQAAEVSQFTCHVRGGLLDGFVAEGTNILEPRPGGGKLVGSIVVARKGRSSLAYEVSEGTRRYIANTGRRVGWESTGAGTYKSGSGIARRLVGKSFSSVARSSGPRAFTIDIVVRD